MTSTPARRDCPKPALINNFVQVPTTENNEEIFCLTTETRFGFMTIVQAGEELIECTLPGFPNRLRHFASLNQTPLLLEAKNQLEHYFDHGNHKFDLPLRLSDLGDFQRQVYLAMQNIPRGYVCSYTQLAQAIGRPRSARPVGNMCHINPLPIFIPCHRVVAAVSLGGFAGPTKLKQQLLILEEAFELDAPLGNRLPYDSQIRRLKRCDLPSLVPK